MPELLRSRHVSRLENIIARNRRGNRPREPVIVSLFFGLVILLILGLTVFTDLGKPPAAPPGPALQRSAPGHADGVYLRRAH
jgi:hypothetical protein